MPIYDNSIYAITKPQFLTMWLNGEVEHISKNVMAEKIGVSRTIITQVLTGDYRLRGASLKIFARYLGLSEEEILEKTGARIEGYRRRDEIKQKMALPKEPGNVVVPDPSTTVIVPIYSVEAAAGWGIFNDNVEVLSVVAIDRSILRQYARNVDRLEGLRVKGDSMRPTMEDGDVVFVDRFDDPITDGLYIIKVDGAICAKRLVKLPNHCLRVISDNPEYESYTVNLKEVEPANFEIVGRVVMRFTKV